MLTPFADEERVYRLLESVQRAPSVHNTQPWWFRIVADDRIDLCARFGRDAELAMNGSGMPAVSPFLRRELFISCGAALYNLRLAIRMTGHDLVVWPLPGGPDQSVLASVEIVTGRTKRPTISEQELYQAIPRRHTNRGPYDDRRPAPPPILVAMQTAAAGEEGWLRVLARRQGRTWLREAHDAARKQRDQGYQPDLDQWTNGGGRQQRRASRRLRPARHVQRRSPSLAAPRPAKRLSAHPGLPALRWPRHERELMRPRVLVNKTAAVRLRPRASSAVPS